MDAEIQKRIVAKVRELDPAMLLAREMIEAYDKTIVLMQAEGYQHDIAMVELNRLQQLSLNFIDVMHKYSRT